MKADSYKYIGEFRYKPLPKVLDLRGEIVQNLLGGSLTEWVIGKDRVDVISTDQSKGAFVSFRNCGFATLDEKDIGTLIDALQKATKLLPEQHYGRVGIRLTSLYATKKTFQALIKNFQSDIMKNDFLKKGPLKVNLKDVGLSYILEGEERRLQLNIGPMQKSQARNFFPKKKLPNVGIFIDIDCYRTLTVRNNFKDVRRFVYFARQEIESLGNYVAGVIEGSDGR